MSTPMPPIDAVLVGVRPLGGDPMDVRIREGRIDAVRPTKSGLAQDATVAGITRVDAHGLIMLPGLVDIHTHLREPGGEESETVETGCRAAAAGGFTDVFAMANTLPVTDTAEHVRDLARRAAGQRHARVHVVGAITKALAGKELTPIDEMADAGVTVFSDDGRCVNDPVLMRAALGAAARRGAVIAQHAQDDALAGRGQINEGRAAETTGLPPWPGVAEQIIISRDAVLAADQNAALHVCHLSTRRSVEIVRWAKVRGWKVTTEVTPHHLLLDDELAALADPRFKVNPPLRTADDVIALREGLLDGTIDAVATDHAPHPAAGKARAWCDAPFGMTGLETALAVVARVLSERGPIDWTMVARVMSINPARIGRISDTAGRPLAVGEPATFALVDPGREWTPTSIRRYSRSENTPFPDWVFRHRVVATAVEGCFTHAELEGIPTS